MAFQALKAFGEPPEGESPYQKLMEEVLTEDAARKGEIGAAGVEEGRDEKVEGKGKGKGKAVLVEDEGAGGPIEYDEESDSDWQGPIPKSGSEEEEDEIEDIRA